mmetsp:Transcript_55228/g.159955  ORF Transcript_55228/g.159955 Transcript_55228/m.159955 type:complete len:222 (+) Transcript_55228:73-738(+)
MLKENKEVISFVPGSIKNGKKTLGRIVVHDRSQMEANLPRYFNHNSFASLRRQLNYFCFTRLGKGRQRGATYCNEAVMELDDILKLKRRSADGTPPPPPATVPTVTPSASKHKRSISISSSESEDADEHYRPAAKKARSNSMEYPRTVKVPCSRRSSVSSIASSQPSIVLDLTTESTTPANQWPSTVLYTPPSVVEQGEDVLAGCRALLSFSRSTTTELVI